jgi:hypothetical protein
LEPVELGPIELADGNFSVSTDQERAEMTTTMHEAKKSEMQHRAAEALKRLLAQVSTIKLKEIRHDSATPYGAAGFVAHVDVFGRPHLLACEVRPSGPLAGLEKQLKGLHETSAKFGPNATPVLIAPYLSLEAQAICKVYAAGFLDLEGNARIAVGEVFIGKRTMLRRSFERPTIVIAETFDTHTSPANQSLVDKTHLNESHRVVRAGHQVRDAIGTVATV